MMMGIQVHSVAVALIMLAASCTKSGAKDFVSDPLPGSAGVYGTNTDVSSSGSDIRPATGTLGSGSGGSSTGRAGATSVTPTESGGDAVLGAGAAGLSGGNPSAASGSGSGSGAEAAIGASGGVNSAVNTAGGAGTGGHSAGAGSSAAGNTGTTSGGTLVTYSTNFDLDESPISEGVSWHHTGLDWKLVNTSGGYAFGTQDGSGTSLDQTFNDSFAYLSGFPPNQKVTAVIHKATGIGSGGLQEVELLLRWSDSAHNAHGYECTLAWDGSYIQIQRWEGAYGKYTPLFDSVASGGAPGPVNDGDVYSAQIVGNAITVTLNGKAIARGSDTAGSGGGAKWTDGDPGIGFYRWNHGGATNPQSYCFTSFSATSM